jgi:hypothetical protein
MIAVQPKVKLNFEELLVSRENPFEINVELEIRKIFEYNSDYTFEFQKNEDKYGYDLKVNKYYIDAADYTKETVAFVEIEVSETWKNEWPSFWKDYSFLARKIYEFDYNNDCFTSDLKHDADKTIYVIFNKSITDCICQSVINLSKLKMIQRGFDGVRKNSFLTTSVNDAKIIRGINNMFNFCNNFFIEKTIGKYKLQIV